MDQLIYIQVIDGIRQRSCLPVTMESHVYNLTGWGGQLNLRGLPYYLRWSDIRLQKKSTVGKLEFVMS